MELRVHELAGEVGRAQGGVDGRHAGLQGLEEPVDDWIFVSLLKDEEHAADTFQNSITVFTKLGHIQGVRHHGEKTLQVISDGCLQGISSYGFDELGSNAQTLFVEEDGPCAEELEWH